MKKFNVGDYVCVLNWYYGRIVKLCDGFAYVEYYTSRGTEVLPFSFYDLELAPSP